MDADVEPTISTIAERVRQARLFRGLTQETLARRAGLGLRTLSNLERGRRQPRAKTLVAVAEALAVPLQSLSGPGPPSGPTLAVRLRTARHALGLTQAQVAAQAGLTRASIGRFERAQGLPPDPIQLAAMEHGVQHPPYFTDVALLAQVLGVDADWLYYGEHAAKDTDPAPEAGCTRAIAFDATVTSTSISQFLRRQHECL